MSTRSCCSHRCAQLPKLTAYQLRSTLFKILLHLITSKMEMIPGRGPSQALAQKNRNWCLGASIRKGCASTKVRAARIRRRVPGHQSCEASQQTTSSDHRTYSNRTRCSRRRTKIALSRPNSSGYALWPRASANPRRVASRRPNLSCSWPSVLVPAPKMYSRIPGPSHWMLSQTKLLSVRSPLIHSWTSLI